MRRAYFAVTAVLVVFGSACSNCGGPTRNPDAGNPISDAAACISGFSDCNGVCKELATDSLNCGACGNSCGVGRECQGGQCVRICDAPESPCGNFCVNLQTDNINCGACGNVCTGGQSCVAGQCSCPTDQLFCSSQCMDVKANSTHCGDCDTVCQADHECLSGSCEIVCSAPATKCGPELCANLESSGTNCGQCGKICPTGSTCTNSNCVCSGGTQLCGTSPTWTCVNTYSDNANCGGCGNVCPSGQTCSNGLCEVPCPAGTTRCGILCVDTQHDPSFCGNCTSTCTSGQTCDAGNCTVCDPNTTDCDGDGWKVSEGDCCDSVGGCATDPRLVNPGAVELLGNNIDDNCNGLIDSADVLDTQPCDSNLASDADAGTDFAAALGICRTTTLNPATPQQRTWGLISAQLLRVDGTPLPDPVAASIRGNFGASWMPQEGQKMVVISSGIAADETQTNPGPNGAPGNQSNIHNNGDQVSISTCTNPLCAKDWFTSANPPLKAANALPAAPGCVGGTTDPELANDSVMLVLRLRAPTNARAFQFKALFASDEYPEFVCTEYNDEFVALVNTPSGSPAPVPNPVDKNLLTYTKAGTHWPIAINAAKGTDIFQICETPGTNADCEDMNVSSLSCSAGVNDLTGTGFEADSAGFCAEGGATRWLVTSGNVNPGQIVELRIGLWDVADDQYDSTALLDAFTWLKNPKGAGTE